MRGRVPYDCRGKRLRFHGIREEASGEQDCHPGVRSDDASSTTGVELVVAMAVALGSSTTWALRTAAPVRGLPRGTDIGRARG